MSIVQDRSIRKRGIVWVVAAGWQCPHRPDHDGQARLGQDVRYLPRFTAPVDQGIQLTRVGKLGRREDRLGIAGMKSHGFLPARKGDESI